ncbi:hypothetical protein [Mycolicibacterium holsaticum]|uniref:Uncharacterized protein n=1 Tax=Mycolicibacterium holsaticum TaxID=152142 RepID=A0A1E3R938_9MYCO|nr:hypothetical protein [Mycolicibacterium holsaticum]ODQ86329.1 hypothetical protein BHQ17_20900 [Mycolicibacterium holsaticum]
MSVSAGQELRKTFDDALERASKKLGKKLAWDEHELHVLEAAVAAADRREWLTEMFDAEMAGERRSGVVVNLSGELRQLDKVIAFYLGRVKIGPGVQKNATKQRAAHERWRRHAEKMEEEGNGAN